MSAYRNEPPKKRPPESDRRSAVPRTELIVGVVMFALGVLLLAMWMMRKDQRPRAPIATPEATVPVTPMPVVTAVPQRPASFSDLHHLATSAAISLANAAMLSNRDVLARKAMAMADAITDPKTTCGDYDAAFVALRQELQTVGDAGELGDVDVELGDIERARCRPGTDAG